MHTLPRPTCLADHVLPIPIYTLQRPKCPVEDEESTASFTHKRDANAMNGPSTAESQPQTTLI